MSILTKFKEAEQLPLGDLLAVIQEEEEPISDNGTCPHLRRCKTRRQQLSHYRMGQPCHWVAWGDWERCLFWQGRG
jgi:hypothetical protein